LSGRRRYWNGGRRREKKGIGGTDELGDGLRFNSDVYYDAVLNGNTSIVEGTWTMRIIVSYIMGSNELKLNKYQNLKLTSCMFWTSRGKPQPTSGLIIHPNLI